jgi:uncharacterized protein (DUF924 family)
MRPATDVVKAWRKLRCLQWFMVIKNDSDADNFRERKLALYAAAISVIGFIVALLGLS